MLAWICSMALADSSSTPQPIQLAETIELYSEVERSTGWIPENGPISIKIEVNSDGGLMVASDGTAHLAWGDAADNALSMSVEGTPETGWLSMENWVGFQVFIRFDLGAVSWEGEIFSEGSSFLSNAYFDPFLLESSSPNRYELIGESIGDQLYSTTLNVIPGVADVVLSLETQPQSTLAFTGYGFVSEEQWLTTPESKALIDGVAHFSATESVQESTEDTGAEIEDSASDYLALDLGPIDELLVSDRASLESELIYFAELEPARSDFVRLSRSVCRSWDVWIGKRLTSRCPFMTPVCFTNLVLLRQLLCPR